MFIEIILFVIAITPYVIILMFFKRFRCVIKNMTDIEKFLDEVDTPKEAVDQSLKRDELKGLINSGHADKLPGKIPWTCNRIDKATDKVIEKLHAQCLKGHIRPPKQQGDMNAIASKMMGVKDVNELKRAIDKNPLIRGSMSNMLASSSITLTGHSPMESLGASVYAKCGNYLGFLALGCESFTHLDWKNFQKIAEEKRKAQLLAEVDDVMSEIDSELQ